MRREDGLACVQKLSFKNNTSAWRYICQLILELLYICHYLWGFSTDPCVEHDIICREDFIGV